MPAFSLIRMSPIFVPIRSVSKTERNDPELKIPPAFMLKILSSFPSHGYFSRHIPHISRILFSYPSSTFYFAVVPLIARRAEFHTRAPLTPLARSRLRHARLAVAVVVARPRPPVHDVYDLWLPHSGESGRFCERTRVYHDNRAPPDWAPLCGTTAARIRTRGARV